MEWLYLKSPHTKILYFRQLDQYGFGKDRTELTANPEFYPALNNT